ncbi:beta strand repeat-containing protein, partial [Pedobacter glucosidilyticus]|uniref:beta strand repeat-containing protein n=1 Tax=Pedobacter glucosidilyticus TaxID=1122941 RepID=UPI001FE0C88F
ASQTNVSCFGGSNGAASINTPTGGAGGYTYNWTPGNPTGDGTTSVTGLIAGTWTCTITDVNSCTQTVNFTITQPPALSLTPASQTNVSCFGGSNGAASINTPTGGAGGYTYNWTPGNPTGDGTRSVTGLTAQTYTCTVTDANGCVAIQNFTITAPSALSLTPASQTNVSCFGGSNGAASINTPTGGAGGYTYNWTPGNPTGDGTTSVTGLTAQTYTCTVTDANGCVAIQNFTITAPSALSLTPASQTNVSCFGGSNGAASINTPTGGAGGYTYNWTPGNPTGDGTTSVTGLTAQTYTCTVTDANGCVAIQNFTITAPSALSLTPASQTNVSCFGGSNGAASINTPTGGAGGYTYNWTPGNPTGDGTTSVTGLTAQTYTCTVTDANGCVAIQNFTITQPTALVASTSQTNIACNGSATGVASVSPSGGVPPYGYLWSNGNTTPTASGLAAGTYSVTITDQNACQLSRSFTITQPTALVAATSQTNVACNGGSTGAASISPSGGTTPYTYLWSNGNTTSTTTGLTAGAYSVTVTDANACQLTRNFTITQPTALNATTSQTNASGFGISNGTATVTPSGGTLGYSYSWSPSGGTGATATGLGAGTYTVTITDANACQITRTVTITQPAGITSVSVPASGTYKIGSQLDLTVNYSANVTVTGTPTLPLTVGSANRNANYQSGSGSSALLFRYQIAAGDEDANGIVVGSAIDLSGGASLGGAATTLTNVGSTSAVLIDGIAPNTSFTSTPALLTNATSASFTFSSTESGTFEASLDGGSYTAVTSPSTLTSLSTGSHTYQVRAIDVAGNIDATPASYTWTVDDIAPAAPVITSPAAGAVLTGLSTVISGTAEANSSVSVTINGDVFNTAADGSGNWTITRALTSNSYSVTSVATDAASNSSPISATRSFSVNIDPTINVTGTLAALTTTYGSASSSTNFTVSATNLTTGIIATAPTGFELSNDDTNYSPTLTVGSAGDVASSTVYVRLSKEADAGNYTGDITLSSTGATAKTIATVSSTVNKRSLVVTATGINKEYDANTTATVTLADDRIAGDVLTAAYSTATFDNKNVGTGKAVAVSGISISGTDAGNYITNTTT